MSSTTYYDNSPCEKNDPESSTSMIVKDDEVKKKRNGVITKLFPSSKLRENSQNNSTSSSSSSAHKPKDNEITICGVNLVLPVKPYNCQIAVISKVITAIKQSKNCLVESPTGTGKTLALLCAALAWQQQEKKRLKKQQEDQTYSRIADSIKAQNSSATDITSPQKNITDSEVQFVKPTHGEKSIYEVSIEECSFSYAKKRKTMLDTTNESDGLVGITKKLRASEASTSASASTFHSDSHEDKKQNQNNDRDVTPDGINKQKLLNSLQEQVSMIVDCSLPVIYYSARTHKQLEQVVQEFGRTEYAKASPMTILSSRDVSCIREFDKTLWASKNEMCQSCTKSTPGKDSESNCLYYTNYKALKHSNLPPAFDVNKLVSAGKKLDACPYYAARRMATVAQIVFCPYNYLIEPSIRRSMQIDLNKNIVIIDEGHNIEDVCRDAASYTFKQIEIEDALKELNTASSFRFANNDAFDYLTYLHMALKEWSSWFFNQKPIVDQQPVNGGGEAEYVWEVKNFVETLDNHNIGQNNYPDFSKNAKMLCRKLRDDPRLLVGITQATGILIENLDIVLGYLFRNSGQCIEDYKPVMVRKLQSPFTGRTKSHFDLAAKADSLSLNMQCLNPGVVFGELAAARCVVLASGTLTPMYSLPSELDTAFPYTVSPRHVIPDDRVWVGSLSGVSCDHGSSRSPAVQDALGRVLQRVCELTPHGVLCFLPSYQLMNTLYNRWRYTKMWDKLNIIKDVFRESKRMEEHEIIMNKYYKCVRISRGALLLAVYRGKVAEGMDFKDHQARAVIAIGVPYPGQHTAVKEKMKYNDKYARVRNLLSGREWFKMQAYRALNQAAGRVVRHAGDWGAVLLVDSRYSHDDYCKHLSTWVKDRLGNNHNDYDSFCNEENGLKAFMTRMKDEK